MPETRHITITLVSPDRPGIVHAISRAVVASRGNITESQQFSSVDTDRFFMRLQVETDAPLEPLRADLDEIAAEFGGEVRVDRVGRPARTLILASKAPHALGGLLYRERAGHLPIEVPLVLANHPDLAGLTSFYDVPFEHQPVTNADEKAAFENRVREIVAEHDIELVVLARYMQILSPELCEKLAGRAINIHHSFLPGFKGANPYRQAHARGVKLIGATAHFVTSDLDEGPIIEQNVVRVNHTRTAKELMRIGEDVETTTLATAVRWFAEHRVLQDGVRTIVFD